MPDLRVIPSVDHLRNSDAVQRLEASYGRLLTLKALRAVTAQVREQLLASEIEPLNLETATSYILKLLGEQLQKTLAPSLKTVVNATGIIVHTNLGRAPLCHPALDNLTAIASGYSNLEYNLDTGDRGSRTTHATALLEQLTGAESGIVVNNNAAAVLLVLAALAEGREVVISRGEMVAIGGGFRIPDVLRQSGAILREVGTTNRTKATDYVSAINDRTSVILRIHPSNFSISGFTERPSLHELTAVSSRFDIPVVEDLGSGLIAETSATPSESTVQQSIASGVTVCTFSGDKLLGGPQAGLIVGAETALAPIRNHPLMRALRVDKLTLASLEATLIEHAAGRAHRTVPVTRMMNTDPKQTEHRAESLVRRFDGLPGLTAKIRHTAAKIGGGSTPDVTLSSRAIAIHVDTQSASAVEQQLRAHVPPIIGRIDHDELLLDLLTVDPEDDEVVVAAVTRLVTS